MIITLGLSGHNWECDSSPPTPLVRMDLNPNLRLFAKIEYLQPGGSVKSRIAGPLLDHLILSGSINDNTRYLVEATGGNTAYALIKAIEQRHLDVELVAVLTDKIERIKAERLEANGVRVMTIPYEVGPVNDEGLSPLLAATKEIADSIGGVLVGQFTSPANASTHERTTAVEIMTQLPDPPDAVVLGIGSGGTAMGLARAFRSRRYETRVVVADPEGSVIGPVFRKESRSPVPAKTIVQGIGGDFIPPLVDMNLIDEVVTVSDDETLSVWRQLAVNGFSVGLSSACAVAASWKWSRFRSDLSRCLVLFADHGSRYEDRY